MNKTVSINLGGLFFHIDEDAFQKLNRYFDAIRRSLSPDGKEEIMSDIEGRIAELLSENLKNDKQVVSAREVDEVIAVMGQPEDYRIDEEETKQTQSQAYYTPGYTPATKKFYRDGERGIIAGVCAGAGHYFRIDPLWIRILFIITLFISGGTTTIAYILFWVLSPKAITTTEKLEMTGEPINISNIEKKVREEIGAIGERIQNVDYNRLGATAKTGVDKVGSAFSNIFGVLAKVIGAIIIVFSSLALGAMIIAFIALCFSTGMNNADWYENFGIFTYSEAPIWLIGLLALFAFGIPMFFLFLLGLKILVNNLKSVGSITKYTLLALWLLAVGCLCYFGVRAATELSSESKTVAKSEIALTANDTLQVKFRHNDYFAKDIEWDTAFRITQDSLENEIIYSNNVSLHILKTDEAMPYVQIEKWANAKTMREARKRAEKITYHFEIKGNTLLLDNYFVTDIANKFRNQKVEIYLYLPEGVKFRPDYTVKHYDDSDDSFFNLYWDNDIYTYQMERNNVKCLNCPEDENDADEHGTHYEDFEGGSTSVKINEKGIDVNVKIDKDSIKSLHIQATPENR